eukprot:gene5956-6899_t
MGNLQSKERIDLSPRTLSLTSVDDKVWLGIPEENLFNDSFTIEKYYQLQSKPLSNFKDADHFKSIEQIEHSNIGIDNVTQHADAIKQQHKSTTGSNNNNSGTGTNVNNNKPSQPAQPSPAHKKGANSNATANSTGASGSGGGSSSSTQQTPSAPSATSGPSQPNNKSSSTGSNLTSTNPYHEEYKNRQNIPVYLIDEDPFHTHQITTSLILEDLYSQSNVNTAYYSTLLQKRLSILKRIHLALKREIARKKTFNSMIRELPPLSMAGEPQDCIDSLTKWLLSATASNVAQIKREAMESLISLALSQGSLCSILFALSLIIMPEKLSQAHIQSNASRTKSNPDFKEQPTTSTSGNNQQSAELLPLRLVPFIRQLEQWKVDLPLSPLTRDLLFATWPILWNDNASEDSLSFLSLPNSNIATITSDGEYIYVHDTCGLAKIGTGYFGTHQGRVYARNGNWFPKEKGWIAAVGSHLYYRSPSTDPASLIVIDPVTLQEVGRVHQDGGGSFPTTNNLTLPFGPESAQSSVDESIFLTPHYQITTRSPLFTDGRYLYILTLQRFHSYNNKQFIVDMYDPCAALKHVKRVELRYPDADVNEELVLNSAVLELGSFYTNGHYMMVVLPPPLGADYNYDAKSYVCRAFSLSDGTLIGNYCLENQPIGLASFYDYLNNVIWTYSSSESEIGKYGNEGFGPKHTFPLLSRRAATTTTTSLSSSSSSSTTSTTLISTTITTSMLESDDDNAVMDPKQVVSTVLGMLARLSVDYMPSVSENSSSPVHHLYKLNEPYAVEVHFSTFAQLHAVLKHYQGQLRVGSAAKTLDILRCIVYCLRLLKVNLFRLTSSIRSLERSQQHYQDASRDSLLKCIDQTFLHQLRDLLLGFVIDGIEASKPTIPSDAILPEFNTIIEESCEVLTIGLDLFYPTSLNKANFVFKLLEQVMNHRKSVGVAAPHKATSKDREREKGYSMLLNSVLSLLANHPNASFFALPPLLSEMPSPFGVFNFEGSAYDKPFDPMNLFVPIITHLLMEAQATIAKQSMPQLSRADSSTQHLGFSLYSSAPPPPLASSSPAMRLLLAIQKDLILRVENSIVGTDAPSQALVAYARLLMDKCKELLLGVLDAESSQRNQSILLTDFKSSVVGALLPTLIHSLFLFAYHIWLAKELLPSLVQLIGVVDRVNRRLPKLLNRPELGRQPLQKRSSFVEGPSRISESPHPYHPFMNTRQLVSIPGAVFLSLVFDERSSTSTQDDLLQIYESPESKEPLDQFSLAQWPKRRILIPGDTVVFQFITGSAGGAANPYAFWGYRCNIIGHMPNSDKTSLPWSSHLEKTMCCLAGRFSSSLVSGDPLTDAELDNMAVLESPLFQGGVEEEFVSHVLFASEPSSSTASPHPNPQPQPYPIETMAAGGLHPPLSAARRAVQRLCVALANRTNELYSSTIADFMWMHITGERMRVKGTIRAAQQAVIAALIKHLNLGELALNLALEIIQTRVSLTAEGLTSQALEDGIRTVVKPPQALIDVWRSVQPIRTSIIQKHQENQLALNNAVTMVNEEESSKRRSVAQHTLRETIYKDIADKLIEKASFLIELQSFFACDDTAPPSPTPQLTSEITTAVLSFVLANIPLDDIKRILIARRSRAYTRGLGLATMRDILRCASDHTMKHETLCFIGPALRNSGLVRRRSPPFHYLDHLHGCGTRLLLDIRRTFRLLMEDIGALLQDPNSDFTLKLYALDAFTLNFSSEDADLLTSVDIFNKIHTLMTNDSIWGGMWSSSGGLGGLGGLSSGGGSSAATAMLLHTQSSGSIGSGGSGGNLFSNGSIYSTYIEEEKLEKEKLKKNAKALFRFLGLICVDGGPNNINPASPTSMSAVTNTNCKSLEILRDSFFHLMETQLDSSLLLLQEQNKTYWHGSDLPSSSAAPSSASGNKGRRILRGERSSFNYDFSDGLSLLYILAAFNSVKQRLTSPSFINIFHCILQVGDETHRKLTLRIFRRILPYASPNKLIISSAHSNKRSMSSASPSSMSPPNVSSMPMPVSPPPVTASTSLPSINVSSKSLFSLLLDIVGAISYWGCSSDLQETAKYIDPRFFITSSNYNLFFASNYSTKIDSSNSFFSIFDRTTVLPTSWDTASAAAQNARIRFSNDGKIVTFAGAPDAQNPHIMVRADVGVPESLPLFYFEVKLESDATEHLVVGLYPASHLPASAASSRPGEWKHGFGYEAKSGHKLCHRVNSQRSRIYATAYSRNDVVGCGWNKKEGKIFFTKNGKYLGTAFKNAYGADLVPVVSIGPGASLAANFGATPFLYDVAPLTSSHLELAISERNLPSMALSYASEVVALLRLLLKAPLWRAPLQKYIEEGLKLLPSTIVLESGGGRGMVAPPTLQALLHVFATITLLAGHLDGVWVGARVQVDLGSGRSEHGTIVEYNNLSNIARILLDSNVNRLAKTTHHRRHLRPVSEVSIDFAMFLPALSSVLPSLSVFLRPPAPPATPVPANSPPPPSLAASPLFRTNQRNIYLFVKSRVMKILGSLLKYPDCARYTLDEILVPILVEFALGRPIQFLDEPKIEKMERLSFLLKERIYDTSFKSLISGDSQSNRTPSDTSSSEDQGTVTELDFDEDEMMEIDEFDEIGVIDLDEDDSLDSNSRDDDSAHPHSNNGSRGNSLSHHKKSDAAAKSRQNSAAVPPAAPAPVAPPATHHHGEPDDNEQPVEDDENIAEDDIPEEGIPGKRVQWESIQLGMSVMVSKREKLGLCRSNWVHDMDRVIGCVGVVKNIDKKHKQVQVTFLDDDTFSLVDWWLCYEVFIYPPSSDKSAKHPLQSIDKYSQAQLVHLDASSEMALSILFSRQALISLLVSLPNSVKISYSSFGGAKNLIYILKLTLHTSLLSSFAAGGKRHIANNSITKLFSSVGNSADNYKDLHNLKLLQSKLTYLIRQEALQSDKDNKSGSDTNITGGSGGKSGMLPTSQSLSLSTSASNIVEQILASPKPAANNVPMSGNNNSTNNLAALTSVDGANTSTGNLTKWKSYKPPVLGVTSGLGEPLKTGNLMKQQKIIKLWKRVWVVLSSDTLFYYKSQQSASSLGGNATITAASLPSNTNAKDTPNNGPGTLSNPIGSIDLRDIVSVTQVSMLKQAKIFAKKDFCFQVTVASNKTHLFQAPSQEELNDWLQIINSACISSASFRSKSASSSSQSLVEVLVREAAAQLRDTSHESIVHLSEESPHPYPPNHKAKKIIRIDGALSLLVVFDPKTTTESGYGVLKFFYDPCCTEHICSFSGKASSFPPTLVHAGHFWMIFNSDSPNTEWGYKFTVTPIRMRTSDVSLLPQPSFEFACFLVDWILQLDASTTFAAAKYAHFFATDLVDLLMLHVDSAHRPLDRKLKAINFLTRLLQRHRETATGGPGTVARLEHVKEDMFKLYKFESSGHNGQLLSQYLQRSIELCIHAEINKMHWQSTSPSTSISSASATLPNLSNLPPPPSSNLQPATAVEEPRSWFYRTIKTFRVLETLFKGKGFTKEFIKEAFIETRNKQVVDSPHPYPQGVRVTANIVVPNAFSLKVEFEPKSKTQIYVDYLMFSKITPGGDDLGFFTGDFPTQPIFISGDRFIWSFYSDSNESEWGFRFTVTPLFPDDIQKEHEQQYDQEIDYLQSNPWSHSLDLELVKFVNTIKELHVLYLRFIVLKHFNACCQTFLQYVDLRGASEDWSIAYQLCSLRGLLFYDVKLEVLSNVLQNTRTFGRRPIVYLNRHGSIYGGASGPGNASQQTLHRTSYHIPSSDFLLHQQHLLGQQYLHPSPAHQQAGATTTSGQPTYQESLFFQTFRQIGSIDPSRLRHNERAWEVKLEREGARDAGGPYREAITQIISEFQSPEMGLFLPCHNAQGDVAFNRDKLVPNSSVNSPLSLQLYEFIGKLIGIAIRTKNCIELSFPSIFWKSLICARVDRLDLEAIDKYCTNMLDIIATSSGTSSNRQSIDRDLFNEYIFQTFTTRSIDNSVVELVHDGKNLSVAWDNRLDYIKLLEQYKLNEFKLQIDSMVKGVASIVPLHMLNIYTWQELEMVVCGMPGLDIKLLRRHTRYCGLSPNEPRVVWFWRTLESFSSEEQTLFLRFVWGRSRLPPSNEFNVQFQLQVFIRNDSSFYDDEYDGIGNGNGSSMSIDENQDEYLPEAQTCFFTLSIPNYSSQEIMREKLLYAITTCRDIDADFIIPDDVTSIPAVLSTIIPPLILLSGNQQDNHSFDPSTPLARLILKKENPDLFPKSEGPSEPIKQAVIVLSSFVVNSRGQVTITGYQHDGHPIFTVSGMGFETNAVLRMSNINIKPNVVTQTLIISDIPLSLMNGNMTVLVGDVESNSYPYQLIPLVSHPQPLMLTPLIDGNATVTVYGNYLNTLRSDGTNTSLFAMCMVTIQQSEQEWDFVTLYSEDQTNNQQLELVYPSMAGGSVKSGWCNIWVDKGMNSVDFHVGFYPPVIVSHTQDGYMHYFVITNYTSFPYFSHGVTYPVTTSDGPKGPTFVQGTYDPISQIMSISMNGDNTPTFTTFNVSVLCTNMRSSIRITLTPFIESIQNVSVLGDTVLIYGQSYGNLTSCQFGNNPPISYTGSIPGYHPIPPGTGTHVPVVCKTATHTLPTHYINYGPSVTSTHVTGSSITITGNGFTDDATLENDKIVIYPMVTPTLDTLVFDLPSNTNADYIVKSSGVESPSFHITMSSTSHNCGMSLGNE